MKLSIVATLYFSEATIDAFIDRMIIAAENMAGDDFEMLLVDDGSPDGSLRRVIARVESDPRIKALELSRNFGHHKAMMTGLQSTSGDRVFLIDSDLEEYPEWLSVFEDRMESSDCDVVYGVQRARKGGWFERWTGALFYRVFDGMTGVSLPRNVVTARLMKRAYVDALVSHRERELFIGGLWHLTGFDQRSVAVDKGHSSPTTYTLSRKLDLLISGITAFSNRPLVLIFRTGLLIFLLALVFSGYLLIQWGFFQRPLSGWTSLMASIWLLGGLSISFLGVIGIYLSKIYTETKQRPYSIIRRIHHRSRPGENLRVRGVPNPDDAQVSDRPGA